MKKDHEPQREDEEGCCSDETDVVRVGLENDDWPQVLDSALNGCPLVQRHGGVPTD